MEDWFDKALAKSSMSIIFYLMATYFFNGEIYKLFANVIGNRFQKYLPTIIHRTQFYVKKEYST